MRRDPYRLYAELRPRGPVLRVSETSAWMILDYPSVRQALGDLERFGSDIPASRGSRFDWLLFMDPPRHQRLRALVGQAGCPHATAALEARIRELSARLLDEVVARGEMDVVRDFAEPLPLMVVAELLGLPAEQWPRLKRWSEAIVTLAGAIVGTEAETPDVSERYRAATAEIADELARLLADRRASGRDDLLTRLALAEVDGEGLSGEEIVRFFQLLLATGTETTANLIANAVLCLLDHPAELARLRDAPGLLGAAIEEVLRYRAPVQAALRVTRRPVELAGQYLEPGELVLLMIGAANRDPDQFAEPDRFDIGRDPNPHLTFGHGIHTCLGAGLCRLQARIAISDLLTRLRTFRPAVERPPEPRGALYAHGPSRLPIAFEPA